VTKRKGKSGVDVDLTAENPFANPEAALEPGSSAQLAVLRGNDIEAPDDDEDNGDVRAELREKIKVLIRSADDLYWDLAQAIATVANDKLYKKWGYSSFEAYVNEECRIDKRKGQYFVQIHNYFSTNLKAVLVSAPEVYESYLTLARQLGWVKARILAKEQVVTETNAQALLDKIQNCTVRELEDICSVAASELSEEESDKRTDENVDKLVRLTFQVTLAQKDDIEKAIEHALGLLPSNATRSSALSMGLRSYMDSDITGRGGSLNVGSHLSHQERILELQLVAFDHGNNIVFGSDTLEKLSAAEAN